jgi:hypothetical protein
MKTTAIAILAMLAVSLLSTDALARPWKRRGAGGWGPDDHWGRLYDPRRLETIRGTITRVEVVRRRAMAEGVHITVATDAASVEVHLGPAWFIENQEISLDVGDQVEVRGVRTTYLQRPAIIAAEVTRGDDVLTLRDEAGFPRWAAWRRGGHHHRR